LRGLRFGTLLGAQPLGLPAGGFKDAVGLHVGIEHFQGCAAGVDLVVMGELGEAFEDAEQLLVPGVAQDLHIARAALRRSIETAIGSLLNKTFPTLRRVRATGSRGDDRSCVYRFPPLAECRKRFDELVQGNIDWGSPGSGFFDIDEWEKDAPRADRSGSCALPRLDLDGGDRGCLCIGWSYIQKSAESRKGGRAFGV